MKYFFLLLILFFSGNLTAKQMKRIQFQGFELIIDAGYETQTEDSKTLLIYPREPERIYIRFTHINSTTKNTPKYVANLIREASAKAGTKLVSLQNNKLYHSWWEKTKSGDDIKYWEIAYDQYYLLVSATIVPEFRKDEVVLKALDYIPLMIDSFKALH